MGLSDQAQRKAVKQAQEAEKAAQSAQEKAVEGITTWIEDRTGYAPIFQGERDLAVGLFVGDDPVVTARTYPLFTLDDVLIAYERRDGESIHLVNESEEHGLYLGPRVVTTLSNKWNKTQKKAKLVDGLARAMNTDMKHPVETLRAFAGVCPTCGRPW